MSPLIVIISCTQKSDEPEKFKEKLAELRKDAERRIQQITEVYHRTLEHINKRIAEREARLQEERENLAGYRAQLANWQEQLDKILAKIEEINAKLQAAYADLANKKKSLLDGKLEARFEELENELKKLMESSQLLAEKKHELYQQVYKDNEDVFKNRVARLEAEEDRTKKAYDIIRAKIESLRQAGITHNVVYFMLTFGALGVIAAGWFYSVFIMESQLGSEDSLSFFLRRIIGFGDKQFQQGNPLLTLAVFIGVLLGLLALITLVVGLCHWLLHKKEKGGERRDRGKERNEFSLSLSEDDKLAFYAQIKATSIFEFWLHLVPLVLVVGLAFILISLFGPQAPNDLERLLSALEGQFIGAIIALAATGVMILYISRIIEPRLAKEATGLKRLWRHFELVASVVLFFGLMGFMLYSSAIVNPSTLNPSVANASFLVIVLFTALTLGYGIRFRGLHRDARYLEKALRHLAMEIENNSRPRPLDLKAILSEEFREKFEGIHGRFFDIIKSRNEQVAQLYGAKPSLGFKNIEPGPAPQQNKRFWFFSKKGNAAVVEGRAEQPLHSNVIDERHFPEEKLIVDNLDAELRAQRAASEELKAKIKALENHDGEIEQAIAKRMQAHEASIIELRRRSLRKEKAWHKLQNNIALQRLLDETRLKDGYDLGLLFRWKMSGGLHGAITNPLAAGEKIN